ncbi:hypothetical protein C0Q70_02761 [Pomacea canaliculata]|uniref:AIG1-type G domain-containing protein n=1 Tax=Pomacea canaliculata TaxID=400727 RepID=A0A2T7PR01_POMCA|nr:hypothetical protein C0Q70_02761 [Pomacea canaliculata]
MDSKQESFECDTLSEVRIIIVGKTGNGKSTLGNILLGKSSFPVCCSMSSTTLGTQMDEGQFKGKQLKVVDTPDIANLGLTSDEAQRQVSEWKRLMTPDPHAILLTVRCDAPYTPTEYALYRQLQWLWGGNSLSQRLVVAFTFGDRLDLQVDTVLRTVSKELQSVVKDASGRYVVFNSKATDDEKGQQVQNLLDILEKLGRDFVITYITDKTGKRG